MRKKKKMANKNNQANRAGKNGGRNKIRNYERTTNEQFKFVKQNVETGVHNQAGRRVGRKRVYNQAAHRIGRRKKKVFSTWHGRLFKKEY